MQEILNRLGIHLGGVGLTAYRSPHDLGFRALLLRVEGCWKGCVVEDVKAAPRAHRPKDLESTA